MGKRAFRVAYDGGPYYGFQRQPDVHTVEGELFRALHALGVIDSITPPAAYSAAGRTDSGVSAVAQTVAFGCPQWLTPSAFNSELSETVRVWAKADVEKSFHAIRDAIDREYLYFLYAPEFDLSLAREVAAQLSGYHDFRNLSDEADCTRRNITVRVVQDGDFFLVRVRASGFPRQLVRRLVTLLERVLTGVLTVDEINLVLSAATRDVGIGPAPAHGLVLVDVTYPVEFTVDEAARTALRTRFLEWQTTHLARARVAKLIADSVG